MKALVLERYNDIVFTDVPTPAPEGDHDLLVRIRATAVCGSDIHGYDGSTGRRIPPVIMGHEAAGEVTAVGRGVTHFSPGDRITFDSTVYCRVCPFCRNGLVNLCDNRRVLGVSCGEYRLDGTFAEYAVIPDYIAYRLPGGLSFTEAALTEPVAVAAHAIRITPVSFGETTAVVGAGLIGLSLIMMLAAGTAGRIAAIDTDPERRKAAAAFGADAVFDPADSGMNDHIRDWAGDGGVSRVFEAVGAAAAVQTAIGITRKGGSVTLIGNISPEITIPLQTVVTRQIALLGSCAIAGEYPAVLELMAGKRINVKPLVSATVPLAEGRIWFEKLYARETPLLKVVFEP